MPDAAMMPAIKAALRANELGPGNPYRLSFAGKGSSGASFGVFQADTAANANARTTLHNVLAGAGMDPGQLQRIMAALSVACPSDPLAPADEAAVNAALDSPQGRALVDALDGQSLAIVCGDLDLANKTAAGAGSAIAGDAQLAICLWCNMTGRPSLLLTWLGGADVTQSGVVVAAPGAPVVFDDMRRYLTATAYFVANPRNWTHFSQSVAAGAALLPPAPC
jgi:hypothetical protein